MIVLITKIISRTFYQEGQNSWSGSKEGDSGKVLMDTDMNAEEVAKKSINVASEICVFTNNNIKVEKI